MESKELISWGAFIGLFVIASIGLTPIGGVIACGVLYYFYNKLNRKVKHDGTKKYLSDNALKAYHALSSYFNVNIEKFNFDNEFVPYIVITLEEKENSKFKFRDKVTLTIEHDFLPEYQFNSKYKNIYPLYYSKLNIEHKTNSKQDLGKLLELKNEIVDFINECELIPSKVYEIWKDSNDLELKAYNQEELMHMR